MNEIRLPSRPTKSLRIVVADDEAYIRCYFSRMLPRLGHRVVGSASDGRELVELCGAERPDLVITDIRMPIMSGIEAADQIAKSQSVPVVILSSHDEPVTNNPNIIEFLRKPFELQELARVIARSIT
ncbi:response regulator [Novipirellula aureliae]|nr:response regulator [Novipirellula aureliae]